MKRAQAPSPTLAATLAAAARELYWAPRRPEDDYRWEATGRYGLSRITLPDIAERLAGSAGVTRGPVVAEVKRQEALATSRADGRDYTPHYALPQTERMAATLLSVGRREIQARRLAIPTGWCWLDAGVWSRAGHCWLIHWEDRVHYSRRAGDWWVSGTYLCGIEHGQTWAVRVPGTMLSVHSAIAWLTPAAAKAPGTIRQGDVYLVPSRRMDLSAIEWTDHVYDEAARTVNHPQHPPVHLAGNYKAVRERVLHARGRTAND